MAEYYYDTNIQQQQDKLRSLKQDLFDAFFEFEHKIFAPGALSEKHKHLIAVALGHIEGCPYCIDAHIRRAKEAGATDEEVAEAAFVAAAIGAGSAFAHSAIAMRCLEQIGAASSPG